MYIGVRGTWYAEVDLQVVVCVKCVVLKTSCVHATVWVLSERVGESFRDVAVIREMAMPQVWNAWRPIGARC